MLDPVAILKRADQIVEEHSPFAGPPSADLQISATLVALCEDLRATLEPLLNVMAAAALAPSAAT